METREIRALEELSTIGKEVLARSVPKEHAQTIALSGDLGAGKTAFVKLLAKELGVTEDVTSPTFVVMKSYAIPEHPFLKTLTHIDAYRIESDDEMRVLGFKELLSDPTRLIAIEWPERIAGVIPEDAERIGLVLQGEVRTVTF
jgi:tRNA threonylcarbamoyladenosine biosynthesis protein TsaE